MSLASFSAAASAAISVSSMALAVAVTWLTRPPRSGLLVLRISRRRNRWRLVSGSGGSAGGPLVQAALGDVLHNAVRYQVPDGFAGGDPVAAFAAGDRQRGDLHQGHLAVGQALAGPPVARPGTAGGVR